MLLLDSELVDCSNVLELLEVVKTSLLVLLLLEEIEVLVKDCSVELEELEELLDEIDVLLEVFDTKVLLLLLLLILVLLLVLSEDEVLELLVSDCSVEELDGLLEEVLELLVSDCSVEELELLLETDVLDKLVLEVDELLLVSDCSVLEELDEVDELLLDEDTDVLLEVDKLDDDELELLDCTKELELLELEENELHALGSSSKSGGICVSNNLLSSGSMTSLISSVNTSK